MKKLVKEKLGRKKEKKETKKEKQENRILFQQLKGIVSKEAIKEIKEGFNSPPAYNPNWKPEEENLNELNDETAKKNLLDEKQRFEILRSNHSEEVKRDINSKKLKPRVIKEKEYWVDQNQTQWQDQGNYLFNYEYGDYVNQKRGLFNGQDNQKYQTEEVTEI